MSEKITVMMNGAAGKMGRAVSAGLAALPNMQLIGAVDVKTTETDFGFLCGNSLYSLYDRRRTPHTRAICKEGCWT